MDPVTELLQKIAGGDEEALRSLYSLFRKKIMATAFHYLQQQEDAEEVVQDVFVAIYQAASRYQPTASPDTWIYRITVNKCLDKLRYRSVRKYLRNISSIFGMEDRLALADAPGNNGPDEEEQQLYQAINKLGEQQKTALILTQLQELTIRETAVIMNTTAKAVESLTMRAKANLKKIMLAGDKPRRK